MVQKISFSLVCWHKGEKSYYIIKISFKGKMSKKLILKPFRSNSLIEVKFLLQQSQTTTSLPGQCSVLNTNESPEVMHVTRDDLQRRF